MYVEDLKFETAQPFQ